MKRKSILKDHLYPILALALVVIGLLVTGTMDLESEQAELAQYCEMVELHKQATSKGWPDYKGIYDTECRATSF